MQTSLLSRGKQLLLTIFFASISFLAVSQSYNVNYQTLSFGSTSVNKIGNGQSNGNKVLYPNVITIGGQAIDAIVTTVNVTNVTSFTNYDDNSADVAFFRQNLLLVQVADQC